MAFEWIKSYKKLERDPKTLHFMALMEWSKSETIGFLHRFWWWADDVAPDGVVTSLCLPGVVGGALGYSFSVGNKAVEKMKEARWLDVLESGDIVVHDIAEYRSSSPESREATRERVKKHRAKKRECNADVTRYQKDVTPLEEDKEEEEIIYTSAIADFETSTTATYAHVLEVFKEVTGRRSKDASTKEGAKVLAQAIDCGDLEMDHLRQVIQKGMNDPQLKNQTLRGVARNYGSYLPENKKTLGRFLIRFQCGHCNAVELQRRNEKPEYGDYVPQVKERIQCPKCGKTMKGELRA